MGVVNLESQTLEESIPTGNGPLFLEICPPSKLFIADTGDQAVTVIDLQTRKVLEPIVTGRTPMHLVTKPDGGEIYASNFDAGSVVVINTSNCTLNGSFSVGRNPIRAVISRDGRRLYVANYGSNTVSVLDPPNNRSSLLRLQSARSLSQCISHRTTFTFSC